MRDSVVLIITQQLALLESIEASIGVRNSVGVSGMLWEQTPALLTPERIRESALVVAELFREYQHGIRAEGVVLAEKWFGVTPFLIVAPRCWSDEINCPGYWDVAASDSLGERVSFLLEHPNLAEQNFESLKQRVVASLALPRQH